MANNNIRQTDIFFAENLDNRCGFLLLPFIRPYCRLIKASVTRITTTTCQ